MLAGGAGVRFFLRGLQIGGGFRGGVLVGLSGVSTEVPFLSVLFFGVFVFFFFLRSPVFVCVIPRVRVSPAPAVLIRPVIVPVFLVPGLPGAISGLPFSFLATGASRGGPPTASAPPLKLLLPCRAPEIIPWIHGKARRTATLLSAIVSVSGCPGSGKNSAKVGHRLKVVLLEQRSERRCSMHQRPMGPPRFFSAHTPGSSEGRIGARDLAGDPRHPGPLLGSCFQRSRGVERESSF